MLFPPNSNNIFKRVLKKYRRILFCQKEDEKGIMVNIGYWGRISIREKYLGMYSKKNNVNLITFYMMYNIT